MPWCYEEYAANALLQEDNAGALKETGTGGIVTSKGAIPQELPLIPEKPPVIS